MRQEAWMPSFSYTLYLYRSCTRILSVVCESGSFYKKYAVEETGTWPVQWRASPDK